MPGLPQQRLGGTPQVADLGPVYEARLRSAREPVRRVIRVLPPIDTGGQVEVLYLDGNGQPCTAYFADGDDPPAPTICTGW